MSYKHRYCCVNMKFFDIFGGNKGVQTKEQTKNSKDEYTKACKSNYEDLSYRISQLNKESYGITDYKEFWDTAREIREDLKSACFFKEQKTDLWDRYNEAHNRARESRQRSDESFKYKSQKHKEAIMNKAGLAEPISVFGFMPEDAESMKRCGQILKEAGQMLSEWKHEMRREDKQEAFEYINEVREKVDAWWAEYKGNRAARQNIFVSNRRENLKNNYEHLRKAQDALTRKEAHRDELLSKIANARTESHRETVEGWLEDEESRISDIKEYIERVERWIEEDEAKLR